MQSRAFISMVALLTSGLVASGTEPTKGRYSELQRLHAAMAIPSFPSSTTSEIQLWLHETPKRGRLRTVDLDRWNVSWSLNFFQVDKTEVDLGNVAIISQNGLSIRFIDPQKEGVVVARGDVVAILLSESAMR